MRRELLENKEETKEKHVVAYRIVRVAILPIHLFLQGLC